MLNEIKNRLAELGDKERAKEHQRFFKTGPGQYGEGDIFLGIRVPVVRKLAKEYKDVKFKEVRGLLRSAVHEERLLALLLLVHNFSKGDEPVKKMIYDFYLKSTQYISNWDLVDLSAPKIVGAHLMGKSRRGLYTLAGSISLWERRISIISTSYFISKNDFADTLKISEKLLLDNHDLIHKAVGWMLREVGKRDMKAEEDFLKEHYKVMPRTMLRYAIEKFPEDKRQGYLKGKI